jgi:hypothetical protein
MSLVPWAAATVSDPLLVFRSFIIQLKTLSVRDARLWAPVCRNKNPPENRRRFLRNGDAGSVVTGWFVGLSKGCQMKGSNPAFQRSEDSDPGSG